MPIKSTLSISVSETLRPNSGILFLLSAQKNKVDHNNSTVLTTSLENGTVAVRTRDTQQHGVLKFDYVKEELMRLHNNRILGAENDFRGEKKEEKPAEKQ